MKKQIKVLIGDDSVEYGVSCANFLRSEGMHAITRPHDVSRIFESIINDKPDVVIIDSFQLMDIDLIKKTRNIGSNNAKFIVVSSYEQFESKCDADYFLLKPFDINVLIDIIKSLITSKERVRPEDLKAAVTEMMHDLGIPAHVKGYRYLREAIMDLAKNNELLNNITKKLYPEIADKFNTTASSVERAMRHAIEIAWNRGNYELFIELFGKKRPTNSELIALFADRLKISYMNKTKNIV